MYDIILNKGKVEKMIILASSSPRRKELLEKASFEFQIISPEFDELKQKDNGMKPLEYVKYLAHQKGESVANNHPDKIVIGADTIVVLEEEILEKPADELEALTMLMTLSGKKHQVITAVSIWYNYQVEVFFEVSYVLMKELKKEQILDYIATKEPMDKAGAYAIQGLGSQLVESYDGDYDNIVGLPVKKVVNMLKKFKLNMGEN